MYLPNMKIRKAILLLLIAMPVYFYCAFYYRTGRCSFSANTYPWNVHDDYARYIKKFDYAIIYDIGGFGFWSGYMILGRKNEKWTKAQIQSKMSNTDYIAPFRLKQTNLETKEAELFIEKLEKLNFFDWDAEQDLIDRCPAWGEVTDGAVPQIVLVKGMRVRRMHYNAPYIHMKRLRRSTMEGDLCSHGTVPKRVG
jgi:hypothetical protein